MDVKSIIIHQLVKNRGTKSTVTKRKDVLPIDERVKGFVNDMKNVYYQNSTKDYGIFDPNADTYPYQNFLDDYLNDKTTFVAFSHRAMDHFKAIIDEAVLATGGYVVFAHYVSTNDYVLAVMLNDRVSYAIDNTLNLKESIHLELDKLHVANFVNINKWRNGDGTYLSFTRGTRDVSQYFVRFIGCTDRKPAKESSEKLVKALENYLSEKKYDELKKEEIRHKVYSYCVDKVKNKEQLKLENISFVVNEDAPEDFNEYASREEYELSSSFDGHRSTLNKIYHITYRSKDLNISFAWNLFNRKIFYDSEENKLTIKDVPEKLKEQFPK